MKAIVLAAGEGKRFFKSGGSFYKQVIKINGLPLIRRIVNDLERTKTFNQINVVLGANKECNKSVKEALEGKEINYIFNNNSKNDNNFLSFISAIETFDEDYYENTLLIESDCIFSENDLETVVENKYNADIVWANIGERVPDQFGGFLLCNRMENSDYFQVEDIKILSQSDNYIDHFKKEEIVLKMFGLTFFSSQGLEKYKKISQIYLKKDNLYFHQPIIENIKLFKNISVKISDNSKSFNTIDEFGG